ncbi:hypothetical protein IEQ34_002369 [Dendrobium chrysotoxum]|uniref:Uncharacterized protein n=1 Tax=Dendrobium chrysotoxum TaxID=161865 RepID=A0AAV7HJP4_DENCH|nr:hypothetical protein IEQ34_002369 [Dendrobium chrysotoxum]
MCNFSLSQGESGCLLPSLPSDATLDPSTGISFTCDLNDNIAAPWPSAFQSPSTSCNKSTNYPELPAATSAQMGKDLIIPPPPPPPHTHNFLLSKVEPHVASQRIPYLTVHVRVVQKEIHSPPPGESDCGTYAGADH